jgi:hypothetical protein
MSQHGVSTTTTTPEDSTATPEDHIAICVKAVIDYRGQEIGKWEAISRILGAIESTASSTDIEQRTAAGETYLAMLDEHDRLLSKASSRGMQGSNQVEDEDRGSEENLVREDRSQSATSRSNSPVSIRRKIDESLYAWKTQDQIAPAPLSPSLERTQRMVQNYTADLKHTLWSLQSSRCLPPFPNAEWKHVLSGTAVNLDAFFSGLFSTLADDRTTTTIGGFDLSVGGEKPSKLVQTHGDWTIAWNSTSAAILCAFPHRAFEIQRYSKYILQFFGAFPHSHSKVINLDKAIRRYTGEVKHIELSDVGLFRHLEARYLQDDGAGNRNGTRKEKESAKTSRRSSETCRQWNSGTCNRRASECRYRHLCSNCRANHPSSECPKKDGHEH